MRVDIYRDEVDELLNQSPRIFNAEFNTEFRQSGTAFMRSFTRARLTGKGGLRVRRRVTKRPRGRGGVSIPAKARALGFSASLSGRDNMDGKRLRIRNSNPVTIAHEEGAIITPKKGDFLYVRVSNRAKARRAGVNIRRGQKPSVIRVRKVVIKPRLKFMAHFRGFVSTIVGRMGRRLKRAGERAQATAKRRAAARLRRGNQRGRS